MPSTRRPSLGDRRRLVIYAQRFAEDSANPRTGRAESTGEVRRNQAAYGWRVQRRLRARWYGLVPVKRRTLVALVTLLFSFASALVMLHWCSLWWEPLAKHPEIVRPLRLDRPDSFGTWLNAFLMITTAGASFLVYQLRRYSSDDYHGHYRIWRFAIVFSLIASIDCVTGLISWFGGTVDVILAERDFVAGADWVRLLVGFGGAAFALRMVGEVSRNAIATAAMMLAFALLAVPLAVKWRFLEIEPGSAVTWVPSAALFSRVGLLTSVVVYLRMLYREVRRLDEKDNLRDRFRSWIPSRARPIEAAVVERPKRHVSERKAGAASKSASTGQGSAGEKVVVENVVGEKNPPVVEENGAAVSDLKGKGKIWGFWRRKGRELAQDPGNDALESPPKRTGVSKEVARVDVNRIQADSNPALADATKNRQQDMKAPGISDAENETLEGRETQEPREKKPGLLSRMLKRRSGAADLSADGSELGAKKVVATKSIPAAPASDSTETQAPVPSGKKGWFGLSGRKPTGEVGDENFKAKDASSSGVGSPSSVAKTSPSPVVSPTPTAKVNSSIQDDDDGEDGPSDDNGEELDPDSVDWGTLNKSERRRMRKLMKRQGKAA
jgi:TRAP-type C4-dicarboxylate transport system permease small subunit